MAESSVPVNKQSTTGQSSEPEVIRANIEQTRANMSETVNEIQTLLSPERLSQKAKDTTIRKVEEMSDMATRKAKNWRQSSIETIRNNPIPTALIGIGVGWLLFNGRDSEDGEYGYHPRAAATSHVNYSNESRFFSEAEAESQGPRDKVSDKTRDMAQRTKEKTNQVAGQAGDKANQIRSQVQSRAEDMSQQAQERAYHYSRRAKRGFFQMMEENPLAVGAMTLAAGAVIGLSIPTTRQEDEWLGETKDQMLSQAQTKVKETAEQVQQVAQKTAQSAKETAQREAKKRDLPAPEPRS